MAITTRSTPVLATLLALGLACQGGATTEQGETETEPEDTSTSESTGTTSAEPLGPTFWQDVAPIYYARCVSCHSEGAIGPFALDSYEPAAGSAELCAEAVEARVMPPWSIRDDGSCNSWQYSQALSEEEIQPIHVVLETDSVGQPVGTLQAPLDPTPGLPDPSIAIT